MRVTTRRIYDDPAGRTGYRVLVDRLWPRGLKKDQLRLDAWLREIGPSDALRKWFGHDPGRWTGFRRRYFAELRRNQAIVEQLLAGAGGRRIVLLYAAKDTEHNQAVALKEYLETVHRPEAAEAIPSPAGRQR